jgi:hypothetical protein
MNVTKEQITKATATLVTAIIAHDAARGDEADATGGETFAIYTIGELKNALPGIVTDPIRKALTLGLRETGRLAHSLGGFEMMQDVCQAAGDAARDNRAISIIDWHWDGVGEWVS